MALTYRTTDGTKWGTGKGSNLTNVEGDTNIWELHGRLLVQEARPDPSAGIDYFETVSTSFYVHMTDASVLGPYAMPVAIFKSRGEWAPATAYAVLDTFTINGALYEVIFAHTSAGSFDAGANDGMGHDYYSLMIQTPGASMPTGGATGQVLQKSTSSNYAVTWGWKFPTGGTAGKILVQQSGTQDNAAWETPDASLIGFEPVTGSTLSSTNVADAIEEAANIVAGKQTMWIPAGAMSPNITDGPTLNIFETTNKTMYRTLDFDPSDDQFAQFEVAMPKSWDLGSISFKLFWSHEATTVDFDVVFYLGAIALADGGDLDQTLAGNSIITDTGGVTDTLYVSAESSTFIPSGAALNSVLLFRVHRDSSTGSGDTLGAVARLHGIQVYYTTNAFTDD